MSDSRSLHRAVAAGQNGTSHAPQVPLVPEFHLEYDSFGRLVLRLPDGRSWVGVEPVRAFPFSDPVQWISLLDADGAEVFRIEQLAAVPTKLKELLLSDLANREFTPVIHRIVAVVGDVEPSEWRVETDRGSTRFTLRSEEDVHRLGPQQALIIDTQGIRYLIADLKTLDPASRRILERYLY